MKTRILCALLFGLAACASAPEPANYPAVQAIVDAAAKGHPDLVRLTIHAVPTGGSKSRVIASNVADKLDDWSDPEDLEAMETKAPIERMEGANLDYTAPLLDAAGAAIGAVGVTVSGGDVDAMRSAAKAIADEIGGAIRAAGERLW